MDAHFLSYPIKRLTICLCMDAHFRFYMAEAPSLECQRASLPFCLHYELTNSRTVDIFLKIKSLFKIFEFSTLDLLSAVCVVLSELLSVVLSDLGGHLALCLQITLGSFIYSTWGSPHTPSSTQKFYFQTFRELAPSQHYLSEVRPPTLTYFLQAPTASSASASSTALPRACKHCVCMPKPVSV